MTYELISVDDHLIEPANVWADRLPSAYREIGPRVVAGDRGTMHWEYEDQRSETMGLTAVAGKPISEWDREPMSFEDMIPGCYDPRARLEDLRQDGIVASLCFPSLPGFAGRVFYELKDKKLADLCIKAYNDWLFDEWCSAAPSVYIPMIITQLWDPQLAAAEIRRCAERGARAVSLAENPVPMGLPSYWTDHWDPVWRAAEETDTVVNLHVGTSGAMDWPSPDDSPFDIAIMLSPVRATKTFVNLVESPVPRKFPNIKIVTSEGNIGWLPSTLERCDKMWEKHKGWSRKDDLRPSDIFRRNFFGAFVDDEVGIELRHLIGVDKIMWECDYPHSETPWPDSQAMLARQLAKVPVDEALAMTSENARRVYRWPA